MIETVIATCFILAAQTYTVPPAVLAGIYSVEGGQIGQEVPNKNGSYDLGLMQINTVWLDELSEKWHVPQSQARKMVRDDPCTNIGVAAWILKNHLNESGGDIAEAIAWYHSHTERHGYKYRKKVIASMKSKGLLKPVR